MAIAYRNGTTAGSASGGNLTITKPTDTADGDILVAVCYNEISASAWTAPLGWAQYGTGQVDYDGTSWTNVYWKRASSEGANYTFNIATTWRTIAMAAFSGALASGDPLDSGPTGRGTNESIGIPIATGITTIASDVMRIVAHSNYGGTDVTVGSSGMSQGAHLGGCEIWYLLQASPGASGDKVFAGYAGANQGAWTSYHLAIKPYVAAATSIKKVSGVLQAAIKKASGETLATIKKLAGVSNVS